MRMDRHDCGQASLGVRVFSGLAFLAGHGKRLGTSSAKEAAIYHEICCFRSRFDLSFIVWFLHSTEILT